MGGVKREGCVRTLDQLVPAARHDDRVGGGRREAHAGDPLGVAVLGDGVLALAQGVPQLDGLVAGAGDNLAVVRREGDGEDVLGVSSEAAGGHAAVQVPEAQGGVPGGRQGELAVRGQHNVLDEVGVAAHRLLRHAVLLAALIAGDVPDDQGLVARARDDHLAVLLGGADASDPPLVALHCSAQLDRLGHRELKLAGVGGVRDGDDEGDEGDEEANDQNDTKTPQFPTP